jgi:hypothetical protein
MKILIAIALIAAASPALAGDYSCNGKVRVGAEQSLIIADDRPDHVCVFATKSKLGRQILKQCPDGSRCGVQLPLPPDDNVPDGERVTTIKQIEYVNRDR